MDQRRKSRRRKYRKRRRYRRALRNLIFLICFVVIVRCMVLLGEIVSKEDSTDHPDYKNEPIILQGESVGSSVQEETEELQSESFGKDENYEKSSQAESASENMQSSESDISSSNTDTPWNLILANKWNPLPDNFEVSLVEVVPGGAQVDERIYVPLVEMLEDAKAENGGIVPTVNYGYRAQATQQELYDDKVSEYRNMGYSDSEATEEAGRWVAVPGTSEHQLGLAVDIKGDTYAVFTWLQENSYKYGFIFRYPGSKSDITGVAEEIWHYRYVGVDAATVIYEKGICLEEYVESYN